MTDLELLRSYDRSYSKCTAIVRAMYREGTGLGEIVARLERMGKNPRQSLEWAFGTRRPELIPETMIREYARRKKIATRRDAGKPESKDGGLVSDYCRRCRYYQTYGETCCDYILITGHRRGCPAGEGCTRRVITRRGSNETE